MLIMIMKNPFPIHIPLQNRIFGWHWGKRKDHGQEDVSHGGGNSEAGGEPVGKIYTADVRLRFWSTVCYVFGLFFRRSPARCQLKQTHTDSLNWLPTHFSSPFNLSSSCGNYSPKQFPTSQLSLFLYVSVLWQRKKEWFSVCFANT